MFVVARVGVGGFGSCSAKACNFTNIGTLAQVFSCNFNKFHRTLFLQNISCTAQKMKFSIKDFYSKCDPIRSSLQIWSYLLKKSLIENFIYCAVPASASEAIHQNWIAVGWSG